MRAVRVVSAMSGLHSVSDANVEHVSRQTDHFIRENRKLRFVRTLPAGRGENGECQKAYLRSFDWT